MIRGAYFTLLLVGCSTKQSYMDFNSIFPKEGLPPVQIISQNAVHYDDDRNRLRELLQGRKWWDLSANYLTSYLKMPLDEVVMTLSPTALAYYLPLFLHPNFDAHPQRLNVFGSIDYLLFSDTHEPKILSFRRDFFRLLNENQKYFLSKTIHGSKKMTGL